MLQAQETQADMDPKIFDAFHMMWDGHPSPVMLTKANHTVLAVNPAAASAGIQPGIKCFSLCGPDKPCAACQAHVAMKNNTCARSQTYNAKTGRFVDAFWTPVVGVKGVYVHYANDITDCVRKELLVASGAD
jgi:hypothetical protein